MPVQNYDVLIAGGGITGVALAFFLASNKDFKGRVAIIEPDPTYRMAATPKSAGGIRQQFSTRENILMSRFAVEFIKDAPYLLEVNGIRPALEFKERGYLFMAKDGSALADLCDFQCALGASIHLLEGEMLRSKFPWLNCEDLAVSTFGSKGEGWIDPYALLQAFRAKAKSLGVDFIKDEVRDIHMEKNRVMGVTLLQGGRIACGVLVNQTGVQARNLAAMVNLDLPVFPKKRCVFVFACREDLSSAPLCIDPSGVWWRPESGQYICGISPPLEKDPTTTEEDIDQNLFDEIIWPILAHRVPAFQAIKPTNAWAGHYDYNVFDQNVLIGPASSPENFYFANGFSGHGLQQAPAIGRALSELILYNGYRSLDLSALSYARYIANNPIIERHDV